MNQLKNEFEKVDTEKNISTLTYEEIVDLMKKFGYETDSVHFQNLLYEADINLNGLYNLENFLEFLQCLLSSNSNEQDGDLPVSLDNCFVYCSHLTNNQILRYGDSSKRDEVDMNQRYLAFYQKVLQMAKDGVIFNKEIINEAALECGLQPSTE
ncbi:unnamed protein product [Adineta ricciae]|uniref:EF-hand domain-containing protein n=1 Tax=Adineta ricciae TaxID=249248 RepID=A0A815L268_ADIRI|nr:unnamed protein product [Adineta ricciae]